MRFFPDFSPRKNETALGFGLSWSLVGSAIALTYLASCSYIVPENPRPPRYNTVLGEKRVPPKNLSPSAQPQMRQPAPMPVPQPQSQLTPTPPRPQEQSFVQNTAPMPHRGNEMAMAASQEDYSWWNPRGWFGDAKPAQPANTPIVRQAPTQQQAPTDYNDQITSYSVPAPVMQPLPNSGDYPSLQATPQSPLITGDAQARDKLNYARSDMEAELDAANMRAGQLRNDAAAEGFTPPPEPLPSVTRPSSITANDLGPPKTVSPGKSAYSNEISVSEPVTLTPPQGQGEPIETAGINTSMSTMDPSTSTFDPMSGSTAPIELKAPEGTYQGKRYLPESRYVNRRSY